MDNAAYIIELARSGRSKCNGGALMTVARLHGVQLRSAAQCAAARCTQRHTRRVHEAALLLPFRLTCVAQPATR